MVKLLIYSPLTTPNGQRSGAERVLCAKLDYLKDCSEIETYLSYYLPEQFKGTRLKEIVIENPCSETLRAAIIAHGIDVVMAPNGEANAVVVRNAVEGLSCRVICELHNVPLHELNNTDMYMLKYRFGKAKGVKDKIKTAIKIALFPIYRFQKKKFYKQQYLNTYNASDKYVLLSQSYIEPLKKAIGVDDAQGKLCAIGNPLSFSDFADEAVLAGKEKRILLVARLSEFQKRISLAIKVWSKLEKQFPEWSFDIVGDGEDIENYKQLVKDLGLQRVVFHGSQPSESYYRQSSIFLMTSAYEGWPMTISEAMQNGCIPVVIGNFGAIYDVVTDSNDGYIVPLNNLEDMALQCRRLMVDDALRNQMAKRCVESSKRFAVSNIGPQWVDLYLKTAKLK